MFAGSNLASKQLSEGFTINRAGKPKCLGPLPLPLLRFTFLGVIVVLGIAVLAGNAIHIAALDDVLTKHWRLPSCAPQTGPTAS